MKIVHICIAGPFSDNYSYQENLLTKFHRRLGHEVFVITGNISWHSNGNMYIDDVGEYINDDDVKIIRVKQSNNIILKKIKKITNYYDKLANISPDIIFIHGVQFIDIKPIIKYVEMNNRVRVIADNHADFSNSARTFFSLNIMHKILWKFIAQKLNNVVNIFYGVTPARVNFLTNIYNIPNSKVGLLNMGGDDDFILKCKTEKYTDLLEKYDLNQINPIIVTGGKIDLEKQEVLWLMKYCKGKAITLVVFGSVNPELREKFNSLLEDNIKYVGWLTVEQSYELFELSDLVIFPGRHSVYWEQVVSQQKPLIVKYMADTQHIDIGGNVKYLKNIHCYEEFEEQIKMILTKENIMQMTEAAKDEKYKDFLYSHIAKRSLEFERKTN